MPLFAQVCPLEHFYTVSPGGPVKWFLLQYKRDSPNDYKDAYYYLNDHDDHYDQGDEHYDDHFEPSEYSDDDFGDLGWYNSIV